MLLSRVNISHDWRADCSMSADEEEPVSRRWMDVSAPVGADLVDETSRDSGISLTEPTSNDDDAHYEFSVYRPVLSLRTLPAR